jgi:Protein of unknown function (DUF3149)
MRLQPHARSMETSASQEIAMQALRELFTSDSGLMSVAGIAFMLGMGVFFIRFFLRHIRDDAERAKTGNS